MKLRRQKGSELTHDEVDDNFVELSNGITQTQGSVAALEDKVDAGVVSGEDRNKLAGIAQEATKNDPDEELRDRATHTGTQSASTIQEDTTHRFVSDAEKSEWNNKLGLNDLPPSLGVSFDYVTPTNGNVII